MVKMCSNRNSLSLLVGMQSCIDTLKIVSVLYKSEHTSNIMNNNWIPRYLPKGIESFYPKNQPNKQTSHTCL